MTYLNRFGPNHRELVPLYIVFVVLMVVYGLLDPSLLTISSLSTLSIQFMPLIVASMAQTIVMLTGGIDLSIGPLISMSTAIAATLMTESVSGMMWGIVGTILAGAAAGCINGCLVTFGRLPAIIVTLGTSYFWQGLALSILPQPGGHVAQTFTDWANNTAAVPAGVVLIAIALAAWKFLKNTRFGTAVYATGDNSYGAFVSGVATNRVRVLAYTLAGALVGLAGLGLSGQTGTGDPNIGTPYTLNTIAASVLGGISFFGGQGQVKGTVIGAVIIGSLMNILFFSGLSPFYQYVVQGLILVFAVGFKALSQYKGGEWA